MAWRGRPDLLSPDTSSWQPVVHHPDDPALDALVESGAVRVIHDTILEQLGDLAEARAPNVRFDAQMRRDAVAATLGGAPPDRYGRWVFYPWSARLVHLLPPDEHHELRTDRNRYKITADEQERLQRATIGVVGLSVGQAAAYTLALEGVGGRLRIADFDTLGVSNLNRLRAGVHELSLSKCVIAARAIAELDPYLPVEIFHRGVDDSNFAAFLDGLDLLVEECDDLRMKLRLREGARARRIPVVMDTSDRGLLDIERFDREPDRPLLHGLLGDLRADDLAGLPVKARVPVVLRILGEETLSTRLAATLPEVRETVSTWPQLASAVALGGALVTDAARRILLGGMTTSGRFWVDVEDVVRDGGGRHAAPLPTVGEAGGEGSGFPLPVAGGRTASQGGASVPPFEGHRPPLPDQTPPPVPTNATSVATARALVENAILAPSGHNAQPWTFTWDGAALTGRLDPARSLPALDFADGGAWAALGAASLNAEIAARAAGLAPTLELGPTAADPLRAFRLRPGAGPPDVDPLHAFLARRHANRRLGVRAPLGGAKAALLAEAASEGGTLLLVDDPAGLDALGGVLGAGDRLSFLVEPLHRDIVGGLRWTRREVEATRDGLDVATLELSPSDLAAMKVITRWERAALLGRLGLGRALEDGGRDAVRAASAVGLLVAPGAGPGAYIRGGRALQRVWLRATALGLAVQPAATLPYLFARRAAGGTATWGPGVDELVDALEARFRTVFPRLDDTVEVLLFRLAHAPPATTRSIRRPVDEVFTVVSRG